MTGIKSIRTKTDNPTAKMQMPETEVSEFARWEKNAGALPKSHLEWSDEQKIKFSSLLAGSIISAFPDELDAQWKCALAVGFALIENGKDELNGKAVFRSTRFAENVESFDISMHIRDNVANDVAPTDSKSVTEVATSNGLAIPEERFLSILDDAAGCIETWTIVARDFPNLTGDEIGVIAAQILVIMEVMSKTNSGTLELKLDGMFNEKDGHISETGKSMKCIAKRKTVEIPHMKPVERKFH